MPTTSPAAAERAVPCRIPGLDRVRPVPRPRARRRSPRAPGAGPGLLLAAWLVLWSALAACTSVRARAYGGVIQCSLDGGVALDSTAGGLDLGRNRTDVDGELGLGDRETSPWMRAELGLPIGAVTLSGFGYTETGAGRLAGNHQYGDILPGSQVTAHLAFDQIKAAVHYDLLDLGFVRLAPGAGVDFIDLDVTVTETGTANFERVDNEVFVPMLFAQAELDLAVAAATIDVGYMQASLDDADGSYLDVEALLRVTPAPFVELFAGYRCIEVDVRGRADERRYEADVRLRGWMIGGGVTF
jgi:hypothetical protein